MSALNKKLIISIPILISVIVSVVVVMIFVNNHKPDIDPNLNPIKNSGNSTGNEPKTETTKMNKIYATINGEKLEIKLEIKLEDNSTVSALMKELPLEVSMSDLNSNEKYAYLGNSLPTNTYSPKHIEAGDVMLFGDNCLVIFYKSFDTSYSYTKIGHIDNLSSLGDGSISITFDAEI